VQSLPPGLGSLQEPVKELIPLFYKVDFYGMIIAAV
jgi:hypothetical protein